MLTHPRLFSHHSYYHSLTLSVLTLSVLTPIVIPDYSLTPLVSHSLTHPRVLSHLTSLSAHTHHLSSHTHHLTSSVTTRTLTSFSLVSPHWVISHHLCSERVSVPTSMVSYYHQVITHTHTNPCAPTHSHVLTHSAPLTSFHLILTTNSSQLISHTLPPIMPPSHHHHLITSSYHLSPPIASSHSTQHS